MPVTLVVVLLAQCVFLAMSDIHVMATDGKQVAMLSGVCTAHCAELGCVGDMQACDAVCSTATRQPHIMCCSLYSPWLDVQVIHT
jgi:hypothetical protein